VRFEDFQPFFKIVDKYDGMSLEELLSMQDRVKVIVALEDGRFVIQDSLRKPGWLRISDFGSYGYCARKLWLQLHHGFYVTKDNLKAILRGILSHREWQEKYAEGAAEFEVKDDLLGLIGHIDEVRISNGTIYLLEFKSSWKLTHYHVLQLHGYLYLFKKNCGVEAKGIIVYRRGIKQYSLKEEYFLEYVKRLRKVFLSKEPPPILPKSARSRCRFCPYAKDICRQYPQGPSWSEWLLEFMPNKCQQCEHNRYCKEFKHRYGKPPCEAPRALIKAWVRE